MDFISFSIYSWCALARSVLTGKPAACLPSAGLTHRGCRGCEKDSYLPKPNPRRYRQNRQRWGRAGAQPRTTVAGGDSSCKAVSLGFKTLVCLFVCHWATERMEKNINVILSPMSHRSARAEMPHSSRRRARGSRGRAQGTPKAAHPGSCCLPGPALTPSPSPQLGTPVARGHRRPRDNFPGPGRRRRNLHLYLHFLIAPAGFLGQRQALVSMAGFVRTPRTEGGTKGPQWTCHSPASKAAGGAGRGHRSRGHRSLPPPPPAPPTPGRTQGAPQAGEEAGRQPTLSGHWWFWHCWSSGGDTMPVGLLDGGAESQPPSPGGGSRPVPVGSGARARPRCSPCSRFPLFSAGFLSSWGGFLSPSNFPIPFRDCLAGKAPCPGSPRTPPCPLGSCADPREPADQPKPGPRPGKSWSLNRCCKPSATQQRRGSGQHPSAPRPR